MLAAATGCNMAPHYKRPATPAAPDHFKEAAPGAANTGQGWKPAEPNDTALGGKWWEAYADPDLNALEERVAISNQTIAAAEANYRNARALASEAQAALFPAVSLDPSVIRSRTGAATASNSNPVTRTLYTLPVEASYTLDVWGRIRNTVAQSNFSAQVSAAELATALLSTHSQLAQYYFQLRAVDEQRQILEETLADYEASYRIVKTLFDNGISSDEDLAAAETQRDSARAQATDIQATRAQVEHAIAVLVGVPPSGLTIPVRAFKPTPPTVPVGLPSALLERRPDIAAAERQVASANAGIGIARSAFFPNLTLAASAGYESTATSKLFKYPNFFWSFGPSLFQPLFEGGSLRAILNQARAQYDAAVANYRETVLAAFEGVEDNLSNLNVLSTEVGEQHAARASAQHQLELTMNRYHNGLDSYVNVITAQNTLLTNREAELQAELRRVTASVNLIVNLGGGWDDSQLK